MSRMASRSSRGIAWSSPNRTPTCSSPPRKRSGSRSARASSSVTACGPARRPACARARDRRPVGRVWARGARNRRRVPRLRGSGRPPRAHRRARHPDGQGVVKLQIREYTVKPGEMQEWLSEWRSKILPLRQSFGFEVLGAWTVDGTDQFIWIISYKGPKSWEKANDDYYSSPERKAMDPDPARHLAKTDMRMMTAV